MPNHLWMVVLGNLGMGNRWRDRESLLWTRAFNGEPLASSVSCLFTIFARVSCFLTRSTVSMLPKSRTHLPASLRSWNYFLYPVYLVRGSAGVFLPFSLCSQKLAMRGKFTPIPFGLSWELLVLVAYAVGLSGKLTYNAYP